jgi:nitrogen-specific signal transduction histidine kinase
MLFQLVPLFGYLVGTALHTLIATLVMVRKEKRPSERIFLVLVISLGIWHSGNLIAWALGGIANHGEWLFFAHLARAIAFLGLAALPPLLIHTHVAFLRDSGSAIFRPWLQNFLLLVFYAPILLFLKPLYELFLSSNVVSVQSLAPYVLQYVSWFVIALVLSSAIDIRLAKIQEDEPFRHFYKVLGITLLFIAVLTTFTYILRGREFPQLRGYLEALSIAASIVPSTVLAYFIYRYNFLELVIRRSFFVITLSIVIFGMYFLGVRRLSLFLGSYFDIVPGLFEAISILVLVVTFPIYKKWLQKKVNQVFFREFGYYHELFSELEQTINTIFGVQPLVDYIQKTSSKVLFLDSIHLSIFDYRDGRVSWRATTLPEVPVVDVLVKKIEEEKLSLVRLEDIKEESIISEIKNLSASVVIPIRHKGILVGIFSFKPKPPRRPILTQEMEMLQSLCAQTAMSVSSALLLEEKLELERAMARKERLASIGQMAATLAHEIKNPLSSIKSITQSLEEQVLDSEVKQDLNMVVHEVDRLNHSVNQLLNFARSSSQDVGPVSLVMTMEHVIKILQNESKTQNVLITHHENGVVPEVIGSAFGLQDIFLNLLLNALQAMPSGGEIDVKYVVRGNSVDVVISDSGPGIRPDLISRIFDPFFTTKQTGTGLGLAVVKQKLGEFGGDIEISNLKPNGSQFTLSFPAGRK